MEDPEELKKTMAKWQGMSFDDVMASALNAKPVVWGRPTVKNMAMQLDPLSAPAKNALRDDYPPVFLDQIQKQLFNNINKEIFKKIKERFRSAGYSFDNQEEWETFSRERVTLVDIHDQGIKYIVVDYDEDTEKTICSIKDEFNISQNKGSITITYE